MKKLFLLLLTTCSMQSFAQNHLHVKSGRTFSTFLFRNSEDAKDETLKHVSNPFLGVSYDVNLGKYHVIRTEAGYRQSGARAELNNQKVSWTLNYMDLNVAYLFKVLDLEKVKLYQGVSPAVAFMTGGEQFIGTNYFDLKETESIKTLDYGINFLLNAKIKIIENVYLTLEYRYGMGLRQIEANSTGSSQVSRNRYHGAITGIAIPF